jgi:hypothetical protein
VATIGELRDKWEESQKALPDKLIEVINSGGLWLALECLRQQHNASDEQIDSILRMALVKVLMELASYAEEVTLLSTDRTSAPALVEIARRIKEGIQL